MDLQALLRSVEAKSEWMRTNLCNLVGQESPSEDRSAVNAASEMVELIARDLSPAVTGPIERLRSNFFRGIKRLPVKVA